MSVSSESLAWIEDPRLLEQARAERGHFNETHLLGRAVFSSRCGEHVRLFIKQSRAKNMECIW